MPFEFPTRDYHPATVERTSQKRRKSAVPQIKLPRDKKTLDVQFEDKIVRLTNLNKLFWPKLGVTKLDLIQYYLDVAPVLLPHVFDRAMVMKRYPNGAAGEFFFMRDESYLPSVFSSIVVGAEGSAHYGHCVEE